MSSASLNPLVFQRDVGSRGRGLKKTSLSVRQSRGILGKGVGIKHVGFDLVAIARFRKLGKNAPFFKKVFTERERRYCFSYKNPFPHLAGIFAVKEAASKALGVNKFPFAAIEVRHAPSGKPELWLGGKKAKTAAVSISHTDNMAGAVVIR